VRNDGRATPIATLLAHAPDAIRVTAVLMRMGGRCRTPCAGSSKTSPVTTLSVALASDRRNRFAFCCSRWRLALWASATAFWGPVQSLDLGHLGYGMVAVSIVILARAVIVWKKRIQPKERT
jgi:hypothetical protein